MRLFLNWKNRIVKIKNEKEKTKNKIGLNNKQENLLRGDDGFISQITIELTENLFNK